MSNNIWTSEKSQMKLETLESLLIIKCNFEMDCTEFKSFLTNRADVLQKIHSVEKYQKNSPHHHTYVYSDGCFYQNRNVTLSNAIINFCEERNVTIEQKYLVEWDGTHSLIERKTKNTSRSTPIGLHLSPRFRKCFQAIFVDSTRKAGDDTVNMLPALAYDPSGIIYLKTNISAEYELLPHRVKACAERIIPGRLYKEKLPISKKIGDLQDLKKLLRIDCYHFYNTLPYNMKTVLYLCVYFLEK